MKKMLLSFNLKDRFGGEYGSSIMHHGLDDLWGEIEGVTLKSQHKRDLGEHFINNLIKNGFDYKPAAGLKNELKLYWLNGDLMTTFTNLKIENAASIIRKHLQIEFFSQI